MIFGRKGCAEDRRWRVNIWCTYGDTRTIAEQLSRKEAEAIYRKIKKELQKKGDYFEVSALDSDDDPILRTFNKRNVISVVVSRG